jgi:cellulose synthase/poly-beta-1,6-N-acetylglucosamine synthase-like glycosyltransferase
MNGLRRWLDRIGFLCVSSGVFVFGYVQGKIRLDVGIAVVAFADLLQAVISAVAFAGFILVSTLAFGWAFLRAPRVDPTVDGESVTAIVPVYGDADVLPRSVESLLDADYEDLTVVIVCESDDRASIRRAESYAERESVQCLVNDRYPGTKAGAINYAAEETDSDHVAVFDADEVVDPNFVGTAVSKLETSDVVQGRTVPEPSGIVEELAYYESVLLSYVSRRLLYVFTDFRMASSRAVVMRRTAFERVGGYDTRMLTEDFDFSYQCYKARLDVVDELSAPSKIEAAHSLTDWWGQRKRWMTGYSQVLHKLLATMRPFSDYRNLASTAICAATVLGSLFMLSILSTFLVLFLAGAQVMFLLPVAVIVAATASVRALDVRAGTVDHVGWEWLTVPAIFPLYSLTAIKAVIEYLVSWDGQWYSVEKGT